MKSVLLQRDGESDATTPAIIASDQVQDERDYPDNREKQAQLCCLHTRFTGQGRAVFHDRFCSLFSLHFYYAIHESESHALIWRDVNGSPRPRPQRPLDGVCMKLIGANVEQGVLS